jgi:hypothetical protein
MARIRFCWENAYAAAATALAAASSVSALPVSLTKNTDREYAWRSATATTEQTIDIDLGAVTAVSVVALANVVTLGVGVVELYERGDSSSAGTATLVATLAAQDRDTRAVAAFFASQSHRHWQLKWTNPTGASGFASLGFCFLGTYDEPTVNVKVPIPLGRPDPSLGSESVDGQESFALRTKYIVGSLVFDAIAEAQLSELREMYDAIGVSRPLFIVLDTALSWSTWFARLASSQDWEMEPNGAIGRYGYQMSFKEVR